MEVARRLLRKVDLYFEVTYLEFKVMTGEMMSTIKAMLDQVIAWGGALKSLREKALFSV